ncbi:hypothetical protein vseg_016097 [Gypsophila vaccaria]
MAEQKQQKTLTFTIILFIISFLVIFCIFLITNNTSNTLTLLTSPHTNGKKTSFSQNHHFTLPHPNFSTVNGEGIKGVPISGNAENGTGLSPPFLSEPKGSTFDDQTLGMHSQEKDGFALKDSSYVGIPVGPSSGNVENGSGLVPPFRSEYKHSTVDHKTLVVHSPENVGKLGDEGEENVGKKCNLYMGKWVRDDGDGYPVYKPGSCPYVDEAFDCQSNGRTDSEYLKWRWKPDGCDLPRFNATDFLVRLRGKRLLLVGDSMNRNQFESMLCVLREGLPDKSKMYEVHGYKITKGRGFYIFKFSDFNCTIEFIRSHFLVKEGTRVNGQGNSNPTLSIDKIDKTAKKWKQADILVFNTGHWWTHGKTSRGKNYFKEGDHVYPKFDSVEAYRRALKTWARWIDENLNPARQTVFYRAYSSAHYRGGDWDSGGTCNGEKQPILSGAFLDTYPIKMKIVEEVIQQMKVPVVLVNVTRLTNFRKDGHPSIYGKIRTEGKRVSTRKQDCSHWCLPGVPDAWNELIYATLVFQQFR